MTTTFISDFHKGGGISLQPAHWDSLCYCIIQNILDETRILQIINGPQKRGGLLNMAKRNSRVGGHRNIISEQSCIT